MTSHRKHYELGTWMRGVPLIGVIQPGHHVYFERAFRRNGFNQAGAEDLQGYISFRGYVSNYLFDRRSHIRYTQPQAESHITIVIARLRKLSESE